MSGESGALSVSIVIPTRARPRYLETALASIAPQARQAQAEILVVDDDGPSDRLRECSERHGARYEPHPRPLGLNVARNTGVQRSTGELVVFVDDDVEVRDGWLSSLLAAAHAHPDVEVFTGPIVARLEGRPPHGCGRERPPITSLDLGPRDTTTRFAWGSNMAIRRSALERVGPFEESLENGGDEQEWQERLRAYGGAEALYVAGAGLDHRRDAADSRLSALCRAAFVRGRAARRFDATRAEAPSLYAEVRTLIGCLGHVVLRRCPAGLVMVAHSLGRVWQAVQKASAACARVKNAFLRARARAPSQNENTTPASSSDDFPPASSSDDFLSGESGTVGGLDRLRRAALDTGADVLALASGRTLRLDRSARREPSRRKVLVIGVERPEHRELVAAIRAELIRSRHDVEVLFAPAGERGKFENLNALLGGRDGDDRDLPILRDRDWLLAIDDDVILPRGFLDRFLFLAERFELDLAQPAHHLASHAAWRVTRRRAGSVVRETRLVEIGPVTAFARRTFDVLLPFPPLRMGWGLDLHWAALARERGWRCGVVDAIPIRHTLAPAASSYSREQAVDEARAFLERRPYVAAAEAQQTLATHRRW